MESADASYSEHSDDVNRIIANDFGNLSFPPHSHTSIHNDFNSRLASRLADLQLCKVIYLINKLAQFF